MKQQRFDNFIILDFEATTVESGKVRIREIIEFPAYVVRVRDFKILGKFHAYVKPSVIPQISPFTTRLTGIRQEDVDNAKTFPDVFEDFAKGLHRMGVDGQKTIFVTCGNWDLQTMLPKQLRLLDLEHPDFTKSWINLKQAFENHTGVSIAREGSDLLQMLDYFDLCFDGHLHSGKDDVRNLYNLTKAMCERFVLDATIVHNSFIDGVMPFIE